MVFLLVFLSNLNRVISFVPRLSYSPAPARFQGLLSNLGQAILHKGTGRAQKATGRQDRNWLYAVNRNKQQPKIARGPADENFPSAHADLRLLLVGIGVSSLRPVG